jgi:hypothetical protein
MCRLTEAELGERGRAEGVPRVAELVAVRPAAALDG